MDKKNYMTADECARTSGHIFEELSKHGLALYGKDGRGGMQKDMSTMSSALSSIEKSLKDKETTTTESKELSTRRLIAYVIAGAGIIGPIMHMIVEATLMSLGWI